MLGMRKTAALLANQCYAGKTIKLAIKSKIIAVQEITIRVAIKIKSKIIIKDKIIVVQEKSRRARIKIYMCYMLHQAKIIHEY